MVYSLGVRTVHNDVLPFVSSVVRYIDEVLRDPYFSITTDKKHDGLRLELQDPQLYNKVLLVLDEILSRINNKSKSSLWHVMFGTGDPPRARPSSFDYMPYAEIEIKPYLEIDKRTVIHTLTVKIDDLHGILTIEDYPESAIPISPIHVNPVHFYADARPEGSIIEIQTSMDDFVKLMAKTFGCYDMLGYNTHIYLTRENTVGRILKKPKTFSRRVDLTNVWMSPEKRIVYTVFAKPPCSFISASMRHQSYLLYPYIDVFNSMTEHMLSLNV